MSWRKIVVYTIVALSFAALTIGSSAAQEEAPPKNVTVTHHHYKLIDLGTFGGPISLVESEPTENDIINNTGTIVGGADTSVPTPEPGCYNPVNRPDCLISLAFAWNDGHLRNLGTLPGGSFSFAYGINNRGHIVGVSENGQFDPALGNPRFFAVLWENDTIRNLGTLGGMSSFFRLWHWDFRR
jgi:probable HAF family extracellular repeat protein